ncbi:MAG: M3 family oligoendopeptidase [Pirellulales bacterium]
MPTIDFHQIQAPTPTAEGAAAEYESLNQALDAAKTLEQYRDVLARWDDLRRRIETWEALVSLRFQQDTRDEAARAARDYADALRPKLTDLSMRLKRRLLTPPAREMVASIYGSYALDLWEADVLTFEPAIEQDLVDESKLEADYTELLASAKIEFRGETYNLSGIVKFREDADRATRHESEVKRWSWFAENRTQLDDIYDKLVRLRTSMARKLGFADFIGLGYKRMKRVDYGQADVERFRAEVREHLVPLGRELRQRQALALGIAEPKFWDEPVHDPRGNPAPLGDHDWMIERAREMFSAMHPEIGQFFQLMIDSHLMDLRNRPTKAGGGFCTSFPTVGLPYIFANFNGTKGDVEVFTHEIGHALQGYLSREQPLIDYLWPTYESCEIHSMGLEFLTWPHMELFFGPDADRFRRIHLAQSLLFIPYGVAVDHFQHLVYANPDASPADRHAMWQEMERTYLPWRDYGDLPHCVDGGFWQFQRHIYLSPFYYIDYTLAQTCALQFWVHANRDFPKTLDTYLALCRRGGEAPFQNLAQSAGLLSPFTANCLRDVAATARAQLDQLA